MIITASFRGCLVLLLSEGNILGIWTVMLGEHLIQHRKEPSAAAGQVSLHECVWLLFVEAGCLVGVWNWMQSRAENWLSCAEVGRGHVLSNATQASSLRLRSPSFVSSLHQSLRNSKAKQRRKMQSTECVSWLQYNNVILASKSYLNWENWGILQFMEMKLIVNKMCHSAVPEETHCSVQNEHSWKPHITIMRRCVMCSQTFCSN